MEQPAIGTSALARFGLTLEALLEYGVGPKELNQQELATGTFEGPTLFTFFVSSSEKLSMARTSRAPM